jgi:calcium binding protein 39
VYHSYSRAFHVFKVFVANPKKTEEIILVLCRNKIKLIPFLEMFQVDNEDSQLNEEKQLLLE